MSAIVVAAGEWVTVAALVVVRPFKVAGRATMFRLLAMAVAVSVSASEKLGADSLGLRWAAAGLALVVLLSDLPNVIRKGRELLRPGAEPASPADR